MAWSLAALPAAALAVALAVPGLRARLLPQAPSPPDDGGLRPAAAPSPAPALAQSPVARRTPRALPTPPPAATATPPPSPSPPPAPTVEARTVLSGAEAGRFIAEAYKPLLPPAVIAVRGSVAEGRVTLAGEVDLERLKPEFRGAIPAVIENLIARGTAEVVIAGSIVESGGGVARLRLEKVSAGGIPIPGIALRRFMLSELSARGLAVGSDPMVRSVYLPRGIDSAQVEGDRLVLHRPPAPPGP